MTASKEGLDLRPVKVSTISFVDLAGSERGSVSGYEGTKERIRQSEVGLEATHDLTIQHLQTGLRSDTLDSRNSVKPEVVRSR